MKKIIPNDNGPDTDTSAQGGSGMTNYGDIKTPAGQRNLRAAWLDFDPALNTPSELRSYRGSFQPK